MLFINCSNREENCYRILKSLQDRNDSLISLANKNMSFCLGCESCRDSLEKYCVLDDYITNNVYNKIINEDKIIIASPMYMSNINGILKNLLDRFNPLYNHELLRGKKIYLIMSGYASEEENEDEIKAIIDYFNGISNFLYFDFEFLGYFVDSDDNNNKIEIIKEKINK